jgi:MFS transporter, CP family, cyanate transporter
MRTKTVAPELLASILVLGLGFAAGMQLGKIAPLIGRMQNELGISLTFAGWLTALLGVFVAFAAYPATRLIARTGAVWGLKFSALVMVAGAVAMGLSQAPALLLVARGIEAAGYVVLVIAAPSYLATQSPAHLRGVFLALWGSFVPIGYALANLQVGLLPDGWPLTWKLLTFAVPISVLSLLAKLVPLVDISGSEVRPTKRLPIPLTGWALAVAFGFYVYLSIGFFTFLPEYLAARDANGAISPAVIALCVPLGNFVTAALLGGLGPMHARPLAISGFLVASMAATLLYSTLRTDILSMLVFAFAGGVVASSLFAQVPRVAGSEAVATSIIGALAQFGGIATLLGPPIAGFLVETFGWTALGWSFIGVALAGASLCLVAPRKEAL